ncbi:glycosyltransferase [Microbacteriaceae bacterium VKM Ac-2855]|nr:glycosyltransferase [Microbacteriaceae bacterium VKM Ac-2855]
MPRLAVISAHTSPLERPSTGDAGGMNVYLASVLPEIARLGWQVSVYTRGEGVRMLAPGVEVIGVPVAAGDKYALARAAGEFADAARGCDLVHSHYFVSGMAGALLGAPHVHSMHSISLAKNARLAPGDVAEPAERIEAERWVLDSADAVVVAGVSERSTIERGYGVPAERIHVVPPGVDPRFVAGSGPRAGVVLVGRVQPLKGQLLAVQALRMLAQNMSGQGMPAERVSADVPTLTIAGGAAPGRESYLDEVRAAAIGLPVEFTGPVDRDEAARLLRSAAVALMPSAVETFGLVALEAAASGTPVLARRTDGLTDAVAEGRSGLLVDSAEPADWAAALGALIADAPLRERLGAGGIAWAGEHSWSRAASDLDTLYRRLLG